MQAALLYLFRSATFLEDLERSLLAACGNHSPSGAHADTTAMSNARSARLILQRFGCFVWVVRAHGAAGGIQVQGRWSFGDVAGECAGSILWSDEDHHVYALEGHGVEELILDFPDRTCQAPGPWELNFVGALSDGLGPASSDSEAPLQHQDVEGMEPRELVRRMVQRGWWRPGPQQCPTCQNIVSLTQNFRWVCNQSGRKKRRQNAAGDTVSI